VGAYCGSVELSLQPFWASDNTIVVLPRDPQSTSLRFLYYALKAADLNKHAGGAAQPLLTQRDLRPVAIHHPTIDAQRKIAAILSAYDDLIENNNRRIELLEEMAQRIYREWFVDFRYPGHESLPLVESDLGAIPEGWEYQALDTAADLRWGGYNKDQGLVLRERLRRL
jgi:type I restriction enzyme S subunit